MGALARTAHASRHGELAPSYQHRDFGATDAGRLHDNGFLARLGRGGYIRALQPVGVWRSLVAHRVRDAGVAGSNPATPTSWCPVWCPVCPLPPRLEPIEATPEDVAAHETDAERRSLKAG